MKRLNSHFAFVFTLERDARGEPHLHGVLSFQRRLTGDERRILEACWFTVAGLAQIKRIERSPKKAVAYIFKRYGYGDFELYTSRQLRQTLAQ
jgi:hypothetical protein